MQNKNIQTISFFALLLFFILLTARLFGYFFQPLAMAAILGVIFLPVHKFIVGKIKNESLSALITIFIMLIILFIPSFFAGKVIMGEIVSFYEQNKNGGIVFDKQFLANNLPLEWQSGANSVISVIVLRISEWARNLTLDVSKIASDVTGFLLACFLILFSIFYFLKDYKKIKSWLASFLSLSIANEKLLINRLVSSVNGVILGKFLLAFLQGLVAMAGFLVVGLPRPFFWGFLTIFSAFIPIIGTGLVVIPAIIYLFIFKSFLPAIILTAWYAILHLSIDNIVTPKVIGSTTQIHPLLILLSILGGIEFFGPLGFFFGPIIVAISLTLLESYKDNYLSS